MGKDGARGEIKARQTRTDPDASFAGLSGVNGRGPARAIYGPRMGAGKKGTIPILVLRVRTRSGDANDQRMFFLRLFAFRNLILRHRRRVEYT